MGEDLEIFASISCRNLQLPDEGRSKFKLPKCVNVCVYIRELYVYNICVYNMLVCVRTHPLQETLLHLRTE